MPVLDDCLGGSQVIRAHVMKTELSERMILITVSRVSLSEVSSCGSAQVLDIAITGLTIAQRSATRAANMMLTLAVHP